MTLKPRWQVAGLIAAACLLATGAAQAGTVIYNTGNAGTASVALGVNDDGSLNTTPNITSNASATGLAYKFPDGSWQDATAPGCLCEGWGVSVNGTTSGYANVDSDGGANNLTFGAATGVTASTVTTTTSLTSLPGITVTQAYAPSTNAPNVLFQNTVTITNTTGAAVTDVKYVRVMDWDVPLTEFNEFVTIKGTGTTTLLEKSHLYGFDTANPLGSSCDADGCGFGGVDIDVTDAGPRDHGAYFRFNFGTLADGESYTFSIFYGAAGTEADAIAAISAESIELYSLGQSNDGNNSQTTGAPATFIFGFSGVGGTPIECGLPGQPPCPTVPEPISLALVGVGLAAMGVLRRRRGTACVVS